MLVRCDGPSPPVGRPTRWIVTAHGRRRLSKKNRYTNYEKRQRPRNVVEVEQDAALHMALHGFHCREKAWTVLSGKLCKVSRFVCCLATSIS
jgi:hypothetical protein